MLISCTFPGCKVKCVSPGGLKQHCNSAHRDITQEPEEADGEDIGFSYERHPYLTALPVDSHGHILPLFAPPAQPPSPPPLPHTEEAWSPFGNRVEFDFAYLHFVRLQSSEAEINLALDMWKAQVLAAGGDPDSVPWQRTRHVYDTIDAIDDINVRWTTLDIEYHGPRPPTPPAWMNQKYRVVLRDIRQLFHRQMAMKDWDKIFNKVPYRQFNSQRKRVRSNLMSADWAWAQADKISEDANTHGSMFVPFVCGSDKTTVSVATGHQEYHPVYASPGNLTNNARRTNSLGLAPVAFLAIPKTSKSQAKKPAYQTFVRQLYHASLSAVFDPLRLFMTTPDLVRCPDSHLRRVIYGLGPYIADYPEQVWLSCIVSGWCAKCMNQPDCLDSDENRPRTELKTNFVINAFDPGIVWDDFGSRSDVVPFTSGFARADIHELISCDLLHQVIKGTFKDHLVEWIAEYVMASNPPNEALEILKDIDRRISAVPAYPGLRRFPDGRNFAQWTGDDSKALMKVYIAAIAGYVPEDMLKAVATFMDFCYLARRKSHTPDDLDNMELALDHFHCARQIFIITGVRESISLPRQHSLLHYIPSIRLFGSPNGVCSSITESKHIQAVKETWRRSSRFDALDQMLQSITRLDKLKMMHSRLKTRHMMVGSTYSYQASIMGGELPQEEEAEIDVNELGENDDLGPAAGPRTTSSVHLASKPAEGYPRYAAGLGEHIKQPQLHNAIRHYLWGVQHGDSVQPTNIQACPPFASPISVFHSAIARFYAPSDVCGAGGMHSERIRSHPFWREEHARHDTVFVVTGDEPSMLGLTVARVLLFFSFKFHDIVHECALVHWFRRVSEQCDNSTGMWIVQPEFDLRNQRTLEVVHVDSITRGCHLLPIYGSRALPEDFTYHYALTSFPAYYVNSYIDNHTHEFLALDVEDK
ncbi:hypothetical protein F5050DRAFT_1576335 [Lentinula boryana]|uniref:C2H2-type domain-containing protein n=1 Tax=Lentinula boryana TaxID=40481 RepID=A0ABQ8Q6E6_9AGAR|nr:hypothetical protein F5050DRAFT_1576335 [Lentinula boryana]